MAAKKKVKPKKKAPKKDQSLTHIGAEGGISAGRPKGAKNKTTLFKEAMKEGFEQKLMKDGFKVFDAVVQKAVEGDMSAAKMILDRVVPVTKAIDIDAVTQSGNKGITINIDQLIAKTGNPDEVIIEDGEIVED